MPNVYELLGRERKATAMAAWMHRRGISAADAEVMVGIDQWWAEIAGNAHVIKPHTPETIQEILSQLRKLEHSGFAEPKLIEACHA